MDAQFVSPRPLSPQPSELETRAMEVDRTFVLAQLACEQDLPGPAQFSLAALLEYITVCGVLLAFSAIAGIASVACLMAMAAALAARQGWLALASLAGALSAADWKIAATNSDDSYGRVLLAILLAAVLCVWYLRRARARGASRLASAEATSSKTSLEPTILHGREHGMLRVGGKTPLQPADQRQAEPGVPVAGL
jgi:hypothetical protein